MIIKSTLTTKPRAASPARSLATVMARSSAAQRLTVLADEDLIALRGKPKGAGLGSVKIGSQRFQAFAMPDVAGLTATPQVNGGGDALEVWADRRHGILTFANAAGKGASIGLDGAGVAPALAKPLTVGVAVLGGVHALSLLDHEGLTMRSGLAVAGNAADWGAVLAMIDPSLAKFATGLKCASFFLKAASGLSQAVNAGRVTSVTGRVIG